MYSPIERWKALTSQAEVVRLPNVPKRVEGRSISERGERNLARRIERERTARGWSYEALAAQMRAAGCEITKAALYSIERGKPPRRITVDELMAFAEVFADGDVAELLIPIELLEKRVAQQLIDKLAASVRLERQAIMDSFGALVAINVQTFGEREIYDYVWNRVQAMEESEFTEVEVDEYVTDDDVAQLAQIVEENRRKLGELAYWRSREVVQQLGLVADPAWSEE